MLAAAHRLSLPATGHVPFHTIDEALQPGAYPSIEHLDGYIPDYLLRTPRVPEEPAGMSASGKWDAVAQAKQRAKHRQRLDLTKIPAIAGATKRAGVWNCPTQIFYELSGGSLQGIPIVVLLDARRQLINALQDSGAGVLLGSDANHGIREEGRTAPAELQALVWAGLTPYQALVAGTRNMATYFGTLDSVGTVAVGKRADLVLLNANPLADIRNTKRPAGIMLGGRWLARAELDERLAGAPGKRQDYYLWYIRTAYINDLLVPLKQRLGTDTTGSLWLTPQQQEVLYLPIYRPQGALRSILDSLVRADAAGASVPLTSVHSRLLHQVAQQLGASRQVLTAAQQAIFDEEARAWLRVYAAHSPQLTIPGVLP